jgi:two-component system response regulator LytT
MKVLIVEDENIAVKNLTAILSELEYDIEIVGQTESVFQTIKWLENHTLPDLIFMDINLSDGLAFNIFSSITVEAPIIFTTAYDEYAIQAFKVNSIDYLLKPIDAKQIRTALQKHHALSKKDLSQYLLKFNNLNLDKNYQKRILIPIHNKLLPIELTDIVCFYTTLDLTRVFISNGDCYSYRKTLDSIMNGLDNKYFFRANKQFLIAKNCIIDISVAPDSRLLITLKVKVPEPIYISKNKAAEFKKWMVE